MCFQPNYFLGINGNYDFSKNIESRRELSIVKYGGAKWFLSFSTSVYRRYCNFTWWKWRGEPRFPMEGLFGLGGLEMQDISAKIGVTQP